jgi:hypothetical protein
MSERSHAWLKKREVFPMRRIAKKVCKAHEIDDKIDNR